MARVTMTYDLAMAIGKDAANARMRKARRKRWSIGDYNEAWRTFNRLWPATDADSRAGGAK
ncbi:MAG: hypothetical protein AAB368_11230 [bacterium]